jgi:SP family general alpha glucoside:H+ symporter-like MFS transporter
MEGYDVTVLGSFYGHRMYYPPLSWSCGTADLSAAFLRRFGVPTSSNAIGYAIPAPWQSGLSNGASAGGIIGLIVSPKSNE